MANQAEWVPRSPDLSGYAPQSPDLQAYNKPLQPSNHSGWAPQSPDITAFQPLHSLQNQQPPQFTLDSPWDSQRQQVDSQFLTPQYNQYQPQFQPHQSPPQPQYQQQFYSSPHQPQQYSAMAPQTRGGQRMSYKEEENDDAWQPELTSRPAARGRGAPKPDPGALTDPSFATNTTPAQPSAPRRMDTNGVEVKTKFPTARIKRIMQADEDVGKVAQVTPVVVAKALELFMIRLITASAGVARQRGSKRVQTAHMKAAVMQDDQFDNLREIVGKVPDAPTKKADADEDGSEDEAPAGTKRRKKSTAGGRGKKKRDSDDDF